MLRIRDPVRSLEFYEKNFGMKLLERMDVPELGFTNYFLGFTGAGAIHGDKPWYEREGVLELCHNHGAENDVKFTVNNGNKEPHRGFGHICFSVDNLQVLHDELLANGVQFQKKLTDGRQKNIAFALDPDGYWIELIGNSSLAGQKVEGRADLSSLRFNHSMIRVKDPEKSLKFYRDTLGMSLLRTSVVEAAKFNLYFLGYTKDPNYKDNSCGDTSNRETMLELTWNYGTESDLDFHYHNGNDQPQGFGHLGITVPDVQEAMDRLEKDGVSIKKRKHEGKMKFIGFVLDPDGYWIEILPRAPLPDKILSD
jgi:lactoylglutathione lyase